MKHLKSLQQLFLLTLIPVTLIFIPYALPNGISLVFQPLQDLSPQDTYFSIILSNILGDLSTSASPILDLLRSFIMFTLSLMILQILIGTIKFAIKEDQNIPPCIDDRGCSQPPKLNTHKDQRPLLTGLHKLWMRLFGGSVIKIFVIYTLYFGLYYGCYVSSPSKNSHPQSIPAVEPRISSTEDIEYSPVWLADYEDVRSVSYDFRLLQDSSSASSDDGLNYLPTLATIPVYSLSTLR